MPAVKVNPKITASFKSFGEVWFFILTVDTDEFNKQELLYDCFLKQDCNRVQTNIISMNPESGEALSLGSIAEH